MSKLREFGAPPARPVEPFLIWLERVRGLAHASDADLDLISGGWRQRDRLRVWYLDDMTAEMAADSLRFVIAGAHKADRADREVRFLRDCGKVRE
jgi:hypothetical protein